MKKKSQSKRYRARTGITQEATPTLPRQEFEAGQFVDFEIVRLSPWLLEQGLVAEENEEIEEQK